MDRIVVTVLLALGVVSGLLEAFTFMAIMAASAVIWLVMFCRRAGWAALVALIAGFTLLLNEYVLVSIGFLIVMVVLSFLAIPSRRQSVRT